MNKKLLALSSLAFLCAASHPLSADPLVVLPQGDFSCAVQVTPPGDASAAAPAPPNQHYAAVETKIDITQIGHTRRDVTTWSDGSTSQFWYLTDQQIGIYQNPNGNPNDVFLSRGPLSNKTPYVLRLDADSTSWIAKKNLLGNDDGGLHYKTAVTDDGPPAITYIFQAWIDPKTLLPLKFEDDDHVYVLTFSKQVPTDPLVMPPAIQAEYNLWLKASTPHPHVQ